MLQWHPSAMGQKKKNAVEYFEKVVKHFVKHLAKGEIYFQQMFTGSETANIQHYMAI